MPNPPEMLSIVARTTEAVLLVFGGLAAYVTDHQSYDQIAAKPLHNTAVIHYPETAAVGMMALLGTAHCYPWERNGAPDDPTNLCLAPTPTSATTPHAVRPSKGHRKLPPSPATPDTTDTLVTTAKEVEYCLECAGAVICFVGGSLIAARASFNRKRRRDRRREE